jgi:16S rRNA processing protein RimM
VTSRPEWIEVGRISRPHGVHGEVRIVADTDNPERFLAGSLLHARPGRPGAATRGEPQQITLTVAGCRGSEDYPILTFAEVGSRDAAEALRGYVLEIPSSRLPDLDDDEFYPFDLQGLEVRDGAGAHLGSVIEVLDSPAHAILVLSLELGSEVMAPFVKEAVPVVDVAAGYLVVDPTFLDFSAGG